MSKQIWIKDRIYEFLKSRQAEEDKSYSEILEECLEDSDEYSEYLEDDDDYPDMEEDEE